MIHLTLLIHLNAPDLLLIQYDARTWFTWGNEIFQSFRASVWRTRWSTSICFNMFLPWSPSLCIFARRLWASLPQSREDKSPVSTFQLWGHYWASLAYFWAASGGDKDGGRVEEGVRKRLCYYLCFFGREQRWKKAGKEFSGSTFSARSTSMLCSPRNRGTLDCRQCHGPFKRTLLHNRKPKPNWTFKDFRRTKRNMMMMMMMMTPLGC